MTPAQGWSPADYYRASRGAHRAWANSQPQYVIPGVLEEVDATRAEGLVGQLADLGCGVHLLEPAPAPVPLRVAGST